MKVATFLQDKFQLYHPGRIAAAIIACVATLGPPGLMAFIIHRYSVNVPLGDEWDTLPLVLADRQGRLDFASLWAPHNEHRLLLVNIISVLTARLTEYNVVANVWCGFAFELLALVIVWRILKITLTGGDGVLVRPLTAYASLLMFWTVSWANWMWGISSVEFLSGVFWAAVAVWALAEWPRRWLGFFAAFGAAILGACTAAAGFPLFLIVAVALFASRRDGKSLAQFAVFAALSAIFLVLFFRGWKPLYSFSGGQPLWRSALQAAGYMLTYLGSPFTTRFGWKASLPLGFLGLGWFVICIWRALRSSSNLAGFLTPWMFLGAYAILNAALTAYGRLHFGLEQATSTRYTSIAVLFWIATGVISAVLVRRWAGQPASRRAVFAVSGIVMALYGAAYAISYYRALPNIQGESLGLQRCRDAVLNYRTAPNDILQRLHPSPKKVRDEAKELESAHIGPFAHTPPMDSTFQ